jgi:hypothetical protein
MSKQTGSFETLIRGVSEQAPHDRFPGQHWVQNNFISDPVRGLGRRQGSLMVDERPLSPGAQYNAETIADAATFKEYTFFINSVEYSLMYRPGIRPANSYMPGVICINKDDNKILDVAIDPTDLTVVQSCLDGGLSAVGNIAKYVLLAPNNKTGTLNVTDQVLATDGKCAIWVKQGAYSRTYTAKVLNSSGTITFTASYTTPASYYQGVLTTSDIPATATDYQKQVNDRVYAYQTAVNQWIGTAAAAIQPQNIAQELANDFVGAGYSAGVRGSHVVIANSVSFVDVDDGGDGSFIKGVAREVQTIADLSPIHWEGKVVRIRPKGSTSGDASGVYYLKALPKDGLFDGLPKEVIWTEAAGMLQEPTFITLLAEIIGDTFYLASSQAKLQAVSGDANQTPYSPSVAGDLDSQPYPSWLSRRIDHITNFQDRLMLVCGSTVILSKSGDYFNFYRASALTLADDDPMEAFALGSEGDVITASVEMDRSLILFGRQKQYAMDGKNATTPKTIYIATQSKHEDATVCPPVASGNYIFFTQTRESRLTVQQMQPGDYADSFKAFEISTQLDGYLRGTPRQMLALTSPSALFVVTKEFTNGFLTFQYLDSADQSSRLYDAWSAWQWNPVLGQLIGITGSNGSVLTLTVRDGRFGPYFVLDKFSRSANLSDFPYLDSMRLFTDTTGTIQPTWVHADECAIAINKAGGDQFLSGVPLPDYADLIASASAETVNLCGMMGALYSSDVEPTAPYMRDQKEKAILDCTLTLGAYKITLLKSAAMRVELRGISELIDAGVLITDWIYRPSGSWVLNTQQIAETITIPVDIQQEIRDFKVRIMSRNWLPLTLSSIEWAGQFFTQRNG